MCVVQHVLKVYSQDCPEISWGNTYVDVLVWKKKLFWTKIGFIYYVFWRKTCWKIQNSSFFFFCCVVFLLLVVLLKDPFVCFSLQSRTYFFSEDPSPKSEQETFIKLQHSSSIHFAILRHWSLPYTSLQICSTCVEVLLVVGFSFAFTNSLNF